MYIYINFPFGNPISLINSMKINIIIRRIRIISLDVKQEDTIKNIKLLAFEKLSVPQIDFCIFFKDKKLEDDKTLKDYSITENSTLFLDFDPNDSIYMKFIVQTPESMHIQFNLCPKNRILDIKDELQRKYNYILGQQHLFYNENELEDINTLKECKIQNGSIIHLVINENLGGSLRIWIKTLFLNDIYHQKSPKSFQYHQISKTFF